MKNKNVLFRVVWLLSFSAFLILSGCASTQEIMQEDAGPFEPYNRVMFKFNDTLDKAVIKPVARGYDYVMPDLLNQGVTNFFSNLNDVVVLANGLMQLKMQQAVMDFSRIVFNTTFGLLGFFDVASHMELPKHNEDFGQTLGYWGVAEGYYLVLPLLGPSTTRDVWRVPVDTLTLHPITDLVSTSTWLSMRGLEIIDIRADLLRVERAFAGVQIDPYSFQRQAFLQHRRNLVYDGNPPKLELDFDDFDDMEDLDSDMPEGPTDEVPENNGSDL
jgi:phospholipid-binding lipoprotein MlaA